MLRAAKCASASAIVRSIFAMTAPTSPSASVSGLPVSSAMPRASSSFAAESARCAVRRASMRLLSDVRPHDEAAPCAAASSGSGSVALTSGRRIERSPGDGFRHDFGGAALVGTNSSYAATPRMWRRIVSGMNCYFENVIFPFTASAVMVSPSRKLPARISQAERVEQVALDGALQRARAIDGVVAFAGEVELRGVGQLERELLVGEALDRGARAGCPRSA